MKKLVQFGLVSALVTSTALSQSPAASPTPALKSDMGSSSQISDPRVRRELALAKLLEGQRYMWKSYRLQTQAGKTSQMRLAKPSFESAIELDPTLAEGFTALAELAVALPPGDLEGAIKLASQAIKVNPDNFGGHRLLARFFTIKSRLNDGPVDKLFADKAEVEWREVARLDPRNAEAWAFLSAYAEFKGDMEAQITALRNWVSSAPALEAGFYERRMGGKTLDHDTASLNLAWALARTGKRDEAAAILGELVADNGQNPEAISMLAEVVDSAAGVAAEKIITSLQQAVISNPANVSLIDMLARLQARLGRFDDAVALYKKHIASTGRENKAASSTLSVGLGELYTEKDRYDESIGAFENALIIRGIGENSPTIGEDREFVVYVFEKLIHTAKLASRPEAVKGFIERARKILGKDDAFPDRQMVMFLQTQGNRKEALTLIRSLREKRPADTGLLRFEASLLTDLGQVDEALELMKKSRVSPPAVAGSLSSGTINVPVPASDEFSDLLFISSLYIRAGRSKNAIEVANQAVSAASGSERRQIGLTALATAQQSGGDFAAAERTLREVLKISPGNPMALNNLGYFLTERGERLSEAAEMIAQALRVDPTNPNYLDSLGWVKFKLGQLDEAERLLMKAARVDVESATIREHLGDVLKAKDQGEKARSLWTWALRLSTDASEIQRLKTKLGK